MSNLIHGLKVGLLAVIPIMTTCLFIGIFINMLLKMYFVVVNYLMQYLIM